MRHVTLYVAEDGGDFRIWQRQLTDAEGSLIFAGEPGKSYEFLALATDVAGNRELPTPGVNAASDGADVHLGALPTVPGTTPPNFGQAPEPSSEPPTNTLFSPDEAKVHAAAPLPPPVERKSIVAVTGGAGRENHGGGRKHKQ